MIAIRDLREGVVLAALAAGVVGPRAMGGEHPEIAIGRSPSGQLVAHFHAPPPFTISRSPFPDYPGFATGAIGFESAALDDPGEGVYTLDGASDIHVQLTFADAGVEIHDGIPVLEVGQAMHLGSPFFDYHAIWTIPSPTVAPGRELRLRFVLHDSAGISADSNEVEVSVTPGCHADLDDGTGGGAADGGVDINDLLFFLSRYEQSNFRADLDDGSNTGARDGGVDVNDLLFFLAHYETGC